MDGEIPHGRQVMDRRIKSMIESGVKPDKAEQVARDSLRRVDRRLREEGKR